MSEHGARDLVPIELVRGWIDHPVDGKGIYFADESDGWEFHSYRDLAYLTRQVAAILSDRGLTSGDGVCVVMPTGFACVGAFYGVWAAGGVFTPISPPMLGDIDQYIAHVAAIVDQAQPRLLVTSPDLLHLVEAAVAQQVRRREDSEIVVLDSDLLAQAEPVSSLVVPGETALLQFTSGSTGVPRGVRINWSNLANNITMISQLIRWRDGDAMVSWLPLYHDMGLVGSFLTTIARQGNLHLMRPDQFVRDPSRWLRAMQYAQHTPSPSFALGYVAHRVRPEMLEGLDLSGWRTLAVGSEPVEVADLQSFYNLTAPHGFGKSTFTLAYGLAEATLMVTSSHRERPLTALRIDSATLRSGVPVDVLEERVLDFEQPIEGGGWITGLGYSTPESTVRIVDADGNDLPDGTLGEVVVVGDSVSSGYHAHADDRTFVDQQLFTADAGFLWKEQLFVLGRLGTSLKVRGRSVFMEDVESRLSTEIGIAKGKLAAVAVTDPGEQGIALFAETPPGAWISDARRMLRAELGPGFAVTIVTGPRGLIARTSSGKPRRRLIWERWQEGALTDASDHPADVAVSAGDRLPLKISREYVEALLEQVSGVVDIPANAAVLLEGSLAEGFGNEGSDIDFLVVSPGSEKTPTMPTVLFLDGRRVEVRTRSVAQLRAQLERAAAANTDVDEDVLNRCQRFLRAMVVRPESGATSNSDLVDGLRAIVDYDRFAGAVGAWWAGRAVQALRYAVVLDALGADVEAADWAVDGLVQSAKSWLASQGETYLETKWLPTQFDRVGGSDRYRVITGASTLKHAIELAGTLGVTGVSPNADQARFARVPGVTTWSIGQRVHVIRDESVFVLSDSAAAAWRSVVFGRPVCEGLGSDGAEAAARVEFLALGLVRASWRADAAAEPSTQGILAEPIIPALAMCQAVRPLTPPPSRHAPVLGVAGAARGEGTSIELCPLPAKRFAECALTVVWSNIVAENAREDLAGALKDEQYAVADIAAHRLVAMSVRVLLSAYGIHPLPADVAPVATVRRYLPHDGRIDAVVEALERAAAINFATATDQQQTVTILDALLDGVREIASGADSSDPFPASFDSRVQWRRTLDISYDWLRIGGYLNSDLPIDEAADLLASGGAQPHLRTEEQP